MSAAHPHRHPTVILFGRRRLVSAPLSVQGVRVGAPAGGVAAGRRAERMGTDHDRHRAAIGLTPRTGGEFHLVRWTRGHDAWTAETVLAVYVSSTADEWEVDHLRRRRRLPRQEWLRFTP